MPIQMLDIIRNKGSSSGVYNANSSVGYQKK